MEVITYEIQQQVRVRKYPVDCLALCECLRTHKSKQGFNNRQISALLNIPITKVEHWFRRDNSFAIPDENLWLELKNVLQISTDEFDEAILTFEEKDGVYEKGNRMYDEVGVSPTITCADVPVVLMRGVEMEVRQLGNCMVTGHRENPNQGRVYDKEGLSPTLSCMEGGNRQPMIVAMRGRYIDENNSKTMQKLEPNKEGLCNVLTSVQKDNLVMEQVSISTSGKVIDTASTILAGYERTKMTGFNADNGVWCVGGLQEHQTPRTDGISPSLTAAMGMGGGQTPLTNHNYRIRKLTPKECWRLMGFTDTDFMKAEMVNSNTQLYKQAGNSIVKDVLMAIFKEMM